LNRLSASSTPPRQTWVSTERVTFESQSPFGFFHSSAAYSRKWLSGLQRSLNRLSVSSTPPRSDLLNVTVTDTLRLNPLSASSPPPRQTWMRTDRVTFDSQSPFVFFHSSASATRTMTWLFGN